MVRSKVQSCSFLSVAVVLTVSALGLNAFGTVERVRPASLYTGDILQSSATEWFPVTVDGRIRPQFKNGTYNLTASTTNLLGCIWFYVLNGGPADATVDFTDKVFRQAPTYEGEVVNETGAAPFGVSGFDYSPIVALDGLSSSADAFVFSDTKMKFRTYGDVPDWDWIFEGGLVSFAGQDGTRTTGVLSLPLLARDCRLRNIYDHAETYVPALKVNSSHRDTLVRVDGGSFVNNGTCESSTDGYAGYVGTNLIEVVGGAQFDQKGSLTFGASAHAPTRTAVLSVRGAGTTFAFSGEELKAGYCSKIEVADGATFSVCGTGAQTVLLGAGGTAERNAEISVRGAGTTFDFTSADDLLDCRGVGTALTLADGAQMRLANSSFATNATDDVTVNISGKDTKLLFTGAAGSQVHIPEKGRCTVNMTGGYIGHENGIGNFLRLSWSTGSDCTFNMSGGKIEVFGDSSTSSFDIGTSGGATFNMSGGEVLVASGITLGTFAGTSVDRNQLLHQTGGRIYVVGGVNVCRANTSHFTSEVRLDGGEFTSDQIVGGNTKAAGKSGNGFLTADGGTLKPYQTRDGATYPWMEKLDSVAMGPKGLTVDTDGKNIRSKQGVFTNKPGEKGLLVKDGDGTLYLSNLSTYDVARTEVRKGTLLFDTETTVALATTLVLTDGAFSIAGSGSVQNLSVTAIEAGNGELVVDPTDTVTVTGAGSKLDGLKIRFSSAPAEGEPIEVFKFAEPLTEDQVSALRRTLCSNAIAAGCHGRFTYDSGSKSVSFAVVEDAPIAEDANTTWAGSDGVWETDGNWDAGLPAVEKRAVFAENEAAREVTIASKAVAGAVRFTGTGYAVAGAADGDRLEIAGEKGAAEITAAADTRNEIAADMVFDAQDVAIVTADGAELVLSGDVTFGGFRKSGSGTATFGGENAFHDEIVAAGGTLGFAGAQAADGAPRVVAVRDTVRFDAEGLELGKLALEEEVTDLPVVLDVREDATVARIDAKADGFGGFLKRGAGTLTVDASDETDQMTPVTMKGTGANDRPASCEPTFFPADGSAPAGMSGGLTVAEGDVVIRGSSETPEIKVPGTVVVGVNITNVNAAAQPSLTFDGVRVDNWTGTPGHLQVGYGLGREGSVQTAPTLKLLDSSLKLDTLRMGLDSSNVVSGAHAVLACTNSSICCVSQLYLTDCTVPENNSIIRCKDSSIWVVNYQFKLDGAVDAVFDNCRLGKGTQSAFSDDQVVDFGQYSKTALLPTGKVEFVNGTVANLHFPYYTSIPKAFTFVWDDAEWNYGKTGDYDYSYSVANERFRFSVRGEGLVLRPAAGTTFTTHVPFVGEGKVRNLGAGTVKFADGTCRIEGPCYAAAGATVDFSDATSLAKAKVQGPGAFRIASGKGATVVAETADDWTGAEVPVFDGCAVGRLTVDFGRTEDDPLSENLPTGLVVAKLVNGATIDGIRLANTGLKRIRGEFSVTADGEVLLNVVEGGGLILLFR